MIPGNAECVEACNELRARAEMLGIHLDGEQQQRFARYCRLLLEANTRFNLTGVRTPEAVVRTLFFDSLTLVLGLPAHFTGPGAAPCVIDVGSGAGIPGLPLKIVNQDWRLGLVESVGKKARFLSETIDALELTTVRVMAVRAEDAGRSDDWRDAADLCLARAVAPLPTLLEWCAPLVRKGGLLAFPKSGEVEVEAREAGPAARALGVSMAELVSIPEELGLGRGRVIAVYEKTGPTPGTYPRRTGLAKSQPIGKSGGRDRPRGRSGQGE